MDSFTSSSKQPYEVGTCYPPFHSKVDWGQERIGDLLKVPWVGFRGRMCACVTPEHIIFFPVLHAFPEKWIFCLYSKCKDSNTYCSSALRSRHSESVTKGGCEGGICTAGWSFRSPALPLLLGAPLATSTALRAPCCLSLVSSVSAIALSMASSTNHISALHSLPLSTCSPKLLSQL